MRNWDRHSFALRSAFTYTSFLVTRSHYNTTFKSDNMAT